MRNKLLFYIILISFWMIACSSTDTINVNKKYSHINTDTLSLLKQTLEQGIADSAYPGYVFLGVKDKAVILFESGGHFTYDTLSPLMKKTTIFDLASITKAMATTSAIMLLYENGKLNLDQKVTEFLPDFAKNGKENITIYQLLTHTSGLPAWNALYHPQPDSAKMINKLFSLELNHKPGKQYEYSCMGFITLGKIVETITNQSLAAFLEKELFSPLNMNHTCFTPPDNWNHQIAPTEIDSSRGGIIQGKVHDENAYHLGGISGNAGLFSSAQDMAIFSKMLLNKGTYAGQRIFKAETIDLFTKAQSIPGSSRRSLGWSKPTGKNSAGHYFSNSAFGHTGFTGTALWIDPEIDLFGIFLTNRVYPTRNQTHLYKIRSKIFDHLQHSVSEK